MKYFYMERLFCFYDKICKYINAKESLPFRRTNTSIRHVRLYENQPLYEYLLHIRGNHQRQHGAVGQVKLNHIANAQFPIS